MRVIRPVPIGILVTILAIAGIVPACSPERGRSVKIEIVNETSSPVRDLVITSVDAEMGLPAIGAGESVAVNYDTGDSGENEIILIHSGSGRRYVIHPYFQGRLTGRVTVEIHNQDSGLSGTVVIDTLWYPNTRRTLSEAE